MAEPEALADQGGDQLPGGQRTQERPIDLGDALTETRVPSLTSTLAGSSSPSSSSSTKIMPTTSRMCRSASSRLEPQVAAPYS